MHRLTTAGAGLKEVVEGVVVGEPEPLRSKADNASNHGIMAAAFEVENGVDGENALEKGCRALEKLEWSYDNIPFFFNRCETRMAMHGVKLLLRAPPCLGLMVGPRRVPRRALGV